MSLKVLVCDTDWRFAERAQRFLEAHGHQVIIEPVPGEALEAARGWRPDVVVVSSETLEGPAADTIEAIKQLDPRPALLLTGQLDRFDTAWRAWNRGADELLLKPVLDAWELHTAIIKAIQRAGADKSIPAA